VAKIAHAIHFLHSEDIVHSDIKPANILISDTGDPLLCDFGVSRMLTASQSLQFSSSSSSEIRGTIAYMSKEILASQDQDAIKYSRESDVWAFGMTVYALLTKKQPYYEKAAIPIVLLAIIQGSLPTPPANTGQGPTLEYYTWKLCKRCWEPPKDRISAELCIGYLKSMERNREKGTSNLINPLKERQGFMYKGLYNPKVFV
ncbi:kinase-like protein, partial [Fomitiporia mediterranea MF3/22]|uniref:kinase-like protein n=1 Tax=Fomitiporia mediterranea (strain MF3/22) TaxID=694068 RepID=UPI00044073A8